MNRKKNDYNVSLLISETEWERIMPKIKDANESLFNAKESFSRLPRNREMTAKESCVISIANTAVLRACLKFLRIIQ